MCQWVINAMKKIIKHSEEVDNTIFDELTFE